MKTVFQDIRFGIRQLIKMPGFTLTAIVSLALGIGATTAVFSVVYAILMDPYPYKASGSHDPYAPDDAVGRSEWLWRDRNAMAGAAQIASRGRHVS